MVPIKSSEITPEHVYLSRRKFLQAAGLLAANAALLAACGCQTATPITAMPVAEQTPSSSAATPGDDVPVTSFTPSASADELGNPLTAQDAVLGYNNFYEFSLSKEEVKALSAGFPTSPWKVEVGGLVNNPRTFDIDDLRKFDQEERISRLRCVEAWSMVIPWMGFPLSKLLKEVDPQSKAQYVRFETVYNPEEMIGLKDQNYPWPYVEGLRLDEAMHDLTILATGLYGKDLQPQNGAPVRLVVPWKYGFKYIKSIVKITLVEEQPLSFWQATNPREYGFWANVNPEVPHPRWSQATERPIGENRRRETLFLNGYADEVASLYPDLDSPDWYY
jgi:sulfoxide reductase catalytic subunit YedY